LHIGADEVFNIGSCPECSLFKNEVGIHQLYAKFIRKVIKKIKDKYPEIRIIAWDDMYRNWSSSELDNLKVKNHHYIEPCIWSYSGQK